MGIIKKLKKYVFTNNHIYKKALKEPVDECSILLEGGQGKNINGNMFAFLKEIEQEEEWKSYIPYLVVTKETMDDAKKRCRDYHFKKVSFVIRNSDEYKRRLAISKYLMTDNSFPPEFYKRKEQVYLNTWHGTPLKHLGRSDIRNSVSLGNVQKNYFQCDYALFPNEHTKQVFMKDYMLERMFQGNILMADYPRNVSLLDQEAAKILRKKLALEEKEIIAYMPTWRGTGRMADSKSQVDMVSTILKELDQKLKESQILYVNLHFLVSSALDFSEYHHIKPFPDQYETYEFLNICDTLITDYSSVFFDFAVTGRKIILFAYDKEEYLREKGMYLDIEAFPFAIAQTIGELVCALEADGSCPTEAFLETYCRYRDKEVVTKILRLLIKNEPSDLTLEKVEPHVKKQLVCHVGTMNHPEEKKRIREYVDAVDPEMELTLIFENGISAQKAAFLESLPKEVYYYSVVRPEAGTGQNLIAVEGYDKTGLCSKRAKRQIQFEKERLFSGWKPDQKEVLFFHRTKYKYIFNCMDLRGDKKDQQIESEHVKEAGGLKWICMKKKDNGLKIFMKVKIKSEKEPDWEQMTVVVGTKRYPVKCKVSRKNLEWKVRFSFVVPYEDSAEQQVKNKVFLSDSKRNISIGYKNKFLRILAICLIQIVIDKKNHLTYFFQFPKDTLTLMIRDENVTDSNKERIKVFFAWFLSYFMIWWNPILLFEKNASRYEESASVVFEELIDAGYQNAYFVLDNSYPFRNGIPEKYKKNLIDKYSFLHYLCFFRTKTFIGSESKVHSFELRPISRVVWYKLFFSKHNYVFLQHGVMYMVSLDSEQRSFFKPGKNKRIVQKTVVSSELEAKHFIELGGYRPDSLYICGLPKFDRNIWHKDADKITVMLTWRPWEYVQSIADPEQTKYFQMLKRIANQIPEEYKEYLVILPHPLIEEQLKKKEHALSRYIPSNVKYDDILKDTKILITDYSSISYDAFYRGCNVIFCWQEKDECLEEYGPTAKLMLTEELAFGDVNYDYKKLGDLIIRNYQKGQKKEYVDNYRQIVNFHDGHNTDRLIERLKEDEII
jgi:CDP-glycerol glycerophosphotransferase (TagB/SpsB family)